MVKISLVSHTSELEGIKDLQSQNLFKNLSPEEAASQGFLMAEYSLDFLEMMHEEFPSVIAKAGDEVVGYALVAGHSVRRYHDLLADLFDTIDKTSFQGKPLKDTPYVVVGQLCVAEQYRGMQLVQKMYAHFRSTYSPQFAYCITDIAQANPRSLRAHKKSGFQVIDTLNYGGIKWDIVLWDWHHAPAD